MKIFKCLLILSPIVFSLVSCNNNPLVVITLNPDGGEISKTQLTVKCGAKYKDDVVPFLPTPTLKSKVFGKWTFTDGNNIPDDYVINENITFKALYYTSEDEKYIKELDIKPVGDTTYLYEASYTDYDYDAGRQYLDRIMPCIENGYFVGGNCASIRKGNFYGRNFDWKHGTIPEFVIRTKAKDNRHATIGTAFCINLKNQNVGTLNDMEGHKMAPFETVDGINDAGLCVSLNEVDKKDVYGTNAGSNTGKPRMNVLMVMRYLLDYASTVKEAETLLKEQDVYTSRYINEQHIMIADATGDTAEIEFKPKTTTTNCHKDIVFIRDDAAHNEYFKNIATNFTLLNYKGDCKNWADAASSLTPHACGTERYNILYDKLYEHPVSLNSLDDTLDVMSSVYYTKTYDNELTDYSSTFWFSEFNYNQLTKTSDKTVSNYQTLYNYYKQRYLAKYRSDGDNYYNTLHSVAYDMANKKMKIVFEENRASAHEYSI